MLNKKSRILELNSILQYCSEKGGIFTKGERICINQERGYLLSLNSENPIVIKVFEYSEVMKFKINSTLENINNSNYQSKEVIDIDWSLEINK